MQLQKLLPFQNLRAGSTATLNIPCGPTYESLHLDCGAAGDFHDLTEVRVKLNGKVVFIVSGADLDAINRYNGFQAGGGVVAMETADGTYAVQNEKQERFLSLFFDELFARDQVGESIGSIGTAQGVGSFIVEADIKAGSTLTDLRAWAIISPPKVLGVVQKLLRYKANFGGAAKWNIPLPFGAAGGSIIKRIYLIADGANITALEVKKNNIVVHESEAAIQQFYQAQLGANVPVAIAHKMYVFDPVVENNMTEMLRTDDATAFEVNPTVDGACTVTAYVEYVDGLGNL